MIGTPANDHPRAFWNADLDEAVGAAVAVLREVRPQVVVGYDEHGGYGHPDHIQAHRVTTRAVDGRRRTPATGPTWAPPHEVAKVYWTCVPVSVLQQGLDALAAADTGYDGVTDAREIPFAAADEDVTCELDGSAFRRPQGGRHGRPRHPADPGRRLLRAVEQPGPAGAHHRVLPAGPRRARPGSRSARAGRPTCSPGCDRAADGRLGPGWPSVVAAWLAVVEVLWLPLRIGPVPVPLSVLAAAVGNLLLVSWAHRLSGSRVVALLPGGGVGGRWRSVRRCAGRRATCCSPGRPPRRSWWGWASCWSACCSPRSRWAGCSADRCARDRRP